LGWNKIALMQMASITLVLVTVLGLVFGSFLNVCITRLPLQQSVVSPRSRCPLCGSPIRFFDNIPLLSWIVLRTKCRECKAPISFRYPLVECSLACLWAICYLVFALTIPFYGAAILCFLLLGLAVMDSETMRLPDTFTLVGTAAAVAFAAIYPQAWVDGSRPMASLVAAAHSLGTAVAGAVLILIIRWMYQSIRGREGMGLGDVKLFAMIAAWLGVERTLLVFFIAIVGGAIFALGFLARTQQRDEHGVWLERKLPFGTFLALSAIYALFLGGSTIRWYLGLF
jgi:leader peptidase (prepilin peptidase) / N-methyltransferase